MIHVTGGGTPVQEAAVWRAALAGARRVVHWPFALDGPALDVSHALLGRWLRRLRLDVDVDTWTTLAGRDLAALADADVLVVGGGTTSRLAREVAEHDAAPVVRTAVAAGLGYLGDSAGAVLAGPDTDVASVVDDDPQAVGMPGLALTGVRVAPHLDRCGPDAVARAARRLGGPVLGFGGPVLGLAEGAGVGIDGDRVVPLGEGARVLIGPDGDALPVG